MSVFLCLQLRNKTKVKNAPNKVAFGRLFCFEWYIFNDLECCFWYDVIISFNQPNEAKNVADYPGNT